MTARNTLLFGAALGVATAAVAVDHYNNPAPRPAPQSAQERAPCAPASPCASASPCAPASPCVPSSPALAPPPPPPAQPEEESPALAPPPAPLPDEDESGA
jgi:hypothetical protein